MLLNSRKFKPECAQVLLRIAAGDLASAQTLSVANVGRPENVSYLAQQAVEKALKAALCAAELPIPMTCNVETLLALLPAEAGLPVDAAAIPALTEFATVRRYEEGFYDLTREELDAVLGATRRTIDWAAALCARRPPK